MNAEMLLTHYERIAEAPDAIERLRRFVLDLALRGKLVPQSAADEPASELLRKITASPPKVGEARLEFALPSGWASTTLGAVAAIVMGQSPPGETYNKSGDGVPLINGPVEFTPGPFGRTVVNQYTTSPTNFCNEGDLLICVRGSTTGRTNVAAFRACLGRGVAAIQPRLESAFLRLFVWSAREAIIAMGRGIAFPSVSRRQLEELPLALPPLAEQHRIVAKMDELMALCDRLEAARTAREATRDRLAAASLARLNTPDPETFPSDAHFALDALPAVTTRPDQIEQLRKTILGLAITGKLTSHAAEETGAAVELEEVERRKRDNSFRKPKSCAPVSADEHWSELPPGWIWARWDQISDWITYGFTRPMPHEDSGIPIVTGKNVNYGRIIFDTAHRTPLHAFNALNEKDRPRKGDILITKDGSIGRTAIVDSDEPFCINQSVAVLWLRSCHFDRQFLRLALDAPQTQQALLAKTEGVAIKHISIVDLGRMVFPLPPLSTQQRIVAKVGELMTLCDALEASLLRASTKRIQLLDAALRAALLPGETALVEAAA